MKNIKVFTLLIISLSVFYLRSQTRIYDPKVKSVQLYREGFVMSKPWIRLGMGERLKLEFDILDDEEETLYYTFIHCDAQWQQDELEKYQYIENFTENELEAGEPSFQVKQDYVHYSLLFPNDDAGLTKSGNYKIIVYSADAENPVLVCPFWVVEQKVNIDAKVMACTLSGQRKRKQEIRFEIDPARISILNPYDDVQVVIMQNGDWHSLLTGIRPKTISGGKLNYEYDGEICMDGHNEFRQFNTKSLFTQTERVKRIYVKHDSVQVNLFPDNTRNGLAYFRTEDMNGECYPGSQDRTEKTTESEYVSVHFSLNSSYPVQDGDVYLYGALTQWDTGEKGKMKYDFQTHQYHNSLYLKQGIYDYEYVVVDKNGNWDYSYFEGNHSETQNQYTILVYYQKPGDFYQSLIGIGSVESYEQ